jgi:hypothetical protein
MAELAGKLNEVWILTGAVAMTDSTGAKIEGVDNSTFTQLVEILDITAFGDTNRNRLAGILDTTFTILGNLYTGDTTGQDELVAGDSVYVGIYPQGNAVAGYQVPAIVSQVEWGSVADGKQTFSADFATNGAVVALPAQAA